MTAERWNKIKEIFLSAKGLAAIDRAGFLERNCGGDLELRAEVERLLAASREDGFLENSAIAEVASAFAPAAGRCDSGGPRFDAGSLINDRYEVVRLLGRGGMGEVYLATDTRINRRVAVKVLHADLVSSEEGLRRFALEAQAVSALNHPHIMTVYESDEMADGSMFIVAEFVEGRGLNNLIGGGLSVARSLEIAIQVAAALSAAHDAGITHRDIKPENLIIRPDGYVKVLDFGLAKLTGDGQPGAGATVSDPEEQTKELNKTRPGAIMGTAAYMSPEQARGRAVDSRTDIWSLGVVIYEMISGRRPFDGDTPADIMAAVLVREPAPLSAFAANLPPELDWIVAKTLSKDVESRYQTSNELRADLEKIRRRIELEESNGSSKDGVEAPPRTDRVSEPIEPRTTAGEAAGLTDGADRDAPRTSGPASGFRQIVSGAQSRKLGTLTAGMLLAVTAAVGIYAAYAVFSRPTGVESIAVLPFANPSGDQDLSLLADGLSETLIDRFAELPRLKVISRSSSFKFRDADPQNAASQLGVQAIVAGSVTRQGDEIVIRVDVVDAESNSQLTGATYRRRPSDLIGLQAEIAQMTARQFAGKISDAESKRLTARWTENSEAFRYYLSGLATLDGSAAQRATALRYYEKALELDPDFALVHAEIGWLYWQQANEADDPSETMPKVLAQAEKALSLDPGLAKAHVVRATAYEYDFDWAKAEQEYRRAIDLSPNLDFARNNYAFFLSVMNRQDEALAQLEEQKLRDPLNQRLWLLQKGIVLVQARRFDAALAAYQQAQSVEPAKGVPDFAVGYAYAGKGLHAEAITYYDKALADVGGEDEFSQPLLYKAISCAHLPERRAEAQAVLNRIEGMNSYVSPALLAALYAALGDNAKANQFLERAHVKRDLLLKYAGVAFEYDALRGDPRFMDLLRRSNLPQVPARAGS